MTPRQRPLAQVAATLERADARLAAIAHVADLVSSFLDTSAPLTPPQAPTRSSCRLFDRVLTRVMKDPAVDPAFRSHWLARSLEAAMKKNDLEFVRLIHHWHSAPLNVSSLKLALTYGSLEVVQWIVENRDDRRCCGPGLKQLCRACLMAALPKGSFHGPDAELGVEWLLSLGVDLANLRGAVRNLKTLSWLNAHSHLLSLDVTYERQDD